MENCNNCNKKLYLKNWHVGQGAYAWFIYFLSDNLTMFTMCCWFWQLRSCAGVCHVHLLMRAYPPNKAILVPVASCTIRGVLRVWRMLPEIDRTASANFGHHIRRSSWANLRGENFPTNQRGAEGSGHGQQCYGFQRMNETLVVSMLPVVVNALCCQGPGYLRSLRMPRVVPDQREKFENDEYFRKLSRESEVGILAELDGPEV